MFNARSRSAGLSVGIVCGIGTLLFIIACAIVLSLIPIYLPHDDSALNDVQDQTQLMRLQYATTVNNGTINYSPFLVDVASATQQLNKQLGRPPNTIIVENIALVPQKNPARIIRRKRGLDFIMLLTCRANYPRTCRSTGCRQHFRTDINQRCSKHSNIIFQFRSALVFDQIIQFILEFIAIIFIALSGAIVISNISFTLESSLPTTSSIGDITTTTTATTISTVDSTTSTSSEPPTNTGSTRASTTSTSSEPPTNTASTRASTISGTTTTGTDTTTETTLTATDITCEITDTDITPETTIAATEITSETTTMGTNTTPETTTMGMVTTLETTTMGTDTTPDTTITATDITCEITDTDITPDTTTMGTNITPETTITATTWETTIMGTSATPETTTAASEATTAISQTATTTSETTITGTDSTCENTGTDVTPETTITATTPETTATVTATSATPETTAAASEATTAISQTATTTSETTITGTDSTCENTGTDVTPETTATVMATSATPETTAAASETTAAASQTATGTSETATGTSETTITGSSSTIIDSTTTTNISFTTTNGNTNNKIVAGYWPNFVSNPAPIRIRDVDPHYNLIYLFSAVPVGGSPGTTGEIVFNDPDDGRGAKTNLINDTQYARNVQNRKIILSVGGAGNSMSFPNRTKSQTFVNSVVALYERFGGFDGLDWDTFEGNQAPDTDEIIWISQELKRLYLGFLITTPPAPWRDLDKSFCQAMVQANALDYAAPQFYDGPGLADQSYVVNHTGEWISLLGVSHVVVGFGVAVNQTNYMTIGEAVATWNEIQSIYPTIRGAFDWEVHSDEAQGWTFANDVGPLVTGS